jgi:predicted AlkP superfamily pyrophosphatase or phosphodiesterase
VKRAALAALVGLLLAAPGAEARVLVVGLDGVRWDVLQQAMTDGRAPHLAGLAQRGFATATELEYTPPAAFTVSEVGWSTIAAGVNPDKHLVTGPLNMDPDQADKNGHPDFLTQIERLAPRLDTFAVTDWGNLGLPVNGGPIFGDAVDARHATAAADSVEAYDTGDQEDADAAVGFLRRGSQDAGFVYFGLPDEVAHLHGSGTQEYADSLTTTDTRVGEVLAAARGWTVIVTTDHGQVDSPVPLLALSHGGPSPLERQSFVIAAGPGVARSDLTRARVVDIHPTVLARVGLPGAADLDGAPFALSTRTEALSHFGRQRAKRAVALRRARARRRAR